MVDKDARKQEGVCAHQPFLYITAAFISGILAGRCMAVPFGWWGLGAVAALVLTAVAAAARRQTAATVLLLAAIAGLGAVAVKSRLAVPEDDIARVARYYYKQPVTVSGIIVSDIREGRSGFGTKVSFTLAVERVRAAWGWRPRSGRVLVNMYRDAGLSYGDRIILEGRLHRPYNFSQDRNFSYSDYLARRGVRYILSVKNAAPVDILEHNQGHPLRALSVRLRDRLKDILSERLSPNEAGLMSAILLGDRTGLPPALRRLFVETGTAHILAISGLHMGIIAALFLVTARMLPIGRRGQFAVVIVLVAAYAFMTGARPSVVRAAVMTDVFLMSLILEKEFRTFNTLCFAGFVILAYDPLNLFDVGFQLSFVCVLAILSAGHGMRRAGLRSKRRYGMETGPARSNGWAHYLIESVGISLAIWVAVAGIVAYYFGIITPVTVLANIAVVPSVCIIVALGFGLLLTGTILPSWAYLFGLCLKVALNIMVGVIFLFGKVPFAYIYTREVTFWHVALYYAAVGVVCVIQWRRLCN